MLYVGLIMTLLSFVFIITPLVTDKSIAIISPLIASLLLFFGVLVLYFQLSNGLMDNIEIKFNSVVIEDDVDEVKEHKLETESKLIVFLQGMVDEKVEYMYQESDSGLHILKAGKNIYGAHFENNEVKYEI